MDDLPLTLLALSAAMLPLVLAARALAMGYRFSETALTVRSFGFIRLQELTFDGARLEAVGRAREELPRLLERLPNHKVVDLTRTFFSRWMVCGFVSTPDRLVILPHPVARALVSRNPRARWSLTRTETRLRLAQLPRRTIRAWPRWLTIGPLPTSVLLLLLTAGQMAYTIRALRLQARAYVRYGVPASDRLEAMTELVISQLSEPLLVFFCGCWILASATAGRPPPSLLPKLASLAVLAGFMTGSRGSHELSHLWEQDCVSYGNTIALFLWSCLGCCALMLTKPVLARLFNPAPARDAPLMEQEPRRW
ncbi:hypothetical protein [Luteolibacter sp. LG18]|uniref:hypothetical protein n=1 Tax=Luteolibacter sp. LG18 TaxID=2819286 RepID=UPI0030C67803